MPHLRHKSTGDIYPMSEHLMRRGDMEVVEDAAPEKPAAPAKPAAKPPKPAAQKPAAKPKAAFNDDLADLGVE